MSNHTALIQDLFANITREGWPTKFNDALADDLVWVATGSSPVAGTYEGKREAWGRILTFVLNDRARKIATRWTSAADGVSIILNASIAASTTPLPEWSVYNATKAAVRSFARTRTTDLKDRDIRVNAVSPGYIEPPPWHSMEAA